MCRHFSVGTLPSLSRVLPAPVFGSLALAPVHAQILPLLSRLPRSLEASSAGGVSAVRGCLCRPLQVLRLQGGCATPGTGSGTVRGPEGGCSLAQPLEKKITFVC